MENDLWTKSFFFLVWFLKKVYNREWQRWMPTYMASFDVESEWYWNKWKKGERRTMTGFSLQDHCFIYLFLSATELGWYPLIVSVPGEQSDHDCTFLYFKGNQSSSLMMSSKTVSSSIQPQRLFVTRRKPSTCLVLLGFHSALK